MRKILLIFAVLFAANLFASIEVNGIYYEFKESGTTNTAKVTYSPSTNNYSGDLVIPETVNYDGKTYTVTEIDGGAFEDCTELNSIHIPASVNKIGSPSRYYMKKITIDENNRTYDSRDNCNAVIKTSTNELLMGCSGTVIPKTVTTLSDGAFDKCVNLKSIVIPESVTEIGSACFQGCANLTEIVCYATTPPTCGMYSFGSVPTDIPVYVPAESISLYKFINGWKDFTNYIDVNQRVIPETYNIAINGDYITNLTCNDVLGDGTVSYNDAEKTLTLNNANISGEDYVIDSYVDLTIKCLGNNTITNTLGDGINCELSTTFAGPGSLSIKAKEIAVYSNYDVTIKDGCTLTLECEDWAGLAIADDELTIDGATLIVKGNGESPSISGCNKLILKNNVDIRTNHIYNITRQCFLGADGNIATDDIIIGLPQTDAIDNLTTAEKATKILREGQVLIFRDGVIYNTLGQEIK